MTRPPRRRAGSGPGPPSRSTLMSESLTATVEALTSYTEGLSGATT